VRKTANWRAYRDYRRAQNSAKLSTNYLASVEAIGDRRGPPAKELRAASAWNSVGYACVQAIPEPGLRSRAEAFLAKARTIRPGSCKKPGIRPISIDWRPGDALPFDVADLPSRRGQVCEYCFFGGPDKDVPLI
jgi:hypothetical protein